jgi:hypothetical protein
VDSTKFSTSAAWFAVIRPRLTFGIVAPRFHYIAIVGWFVSCAKLRATAARFAVAGSFGTSPMLT